MPRSRLQVYRTSPSPGCAGYFPGERGSRLSDASVHSSSLARADGAGPVGLRNLSQRGHVAVEGSPSLLGEGKPGPGPLADVALVHLDVARLFQRAHLLGQDRVRDLHVIPDKAELDLAGCRQQGCDREANGMTE